MIISCTGSPSPSSFSQIPITKKGNLSTVVLALVKSQNQINDGKQVHVFPDGLVFYFIVYPSQSNSNPAIKQFQNFSIDGVFYWQNIAETCDSHTVIYNEKTFMEQEPEVFQMLAIKRNTGALIQKTVICGAPLPLQGIVVYPLFFGFGETLEEFEFKFNLKDIKQSF